MVVPMRSRWEASYARLQIVQRDTVYQLLVFFKDFQFGSCMNFVLKTTDNFEAMVKSVAKVEHYYIRIVDAKFTLPKTESGPKADFVCLDMPEYPSEHDDIMIGFDTEAGEKSLNPRDSFRKEITDRFPERDRFAGALPAAVNKPSRLGNLGNLGSLGSLRR